eukprot:tig00001258_g7827.t1
MAFLVAAGALPRAALASAGHGIAGLELCGQLGAAAGARVRGRRRRAFASAAAAAAVASVAPPARIEVERKFAVTPEDEARVERALRLRSEKSFTDVYYDAPGFPLTRRDVWLRERSGAWELKRPALLPGAGGEGGAPDGVDRYEEVEGRARRPRPRPRAAAGGLARRRASREGYEAFARCSLRGAPAGSQMAAEARRGGGAGSGRGGGASCRGPARARGRRGEGGLSVVVDAMDFGYRILEIEVMAEATPPPSRGRRASSTPAPAASASAGARPGKVLVYLERFRPAHLAALRDAGLLASKRLPEAQAP